MQKTYRPLAKTSLILVYLVILAGAVVRMTGSGMGCPDWPKCFGYLIPPTEEAELLWTAEKTYKKGQVPLPDNQKQTASVRLPENDNKKTGYKNV